MAKPTNPFDELTRAFERTQEMFEEMARGWDAEPMSMESSVRVDLEDKEEELVLTAELPGFDSDDIDVRVTDRTLRIEAQHEEETEEESEGEYVRRERHRASVARSLSLPAAVDRDEIEATHNNGILTVRMPKREPETEGTEIEVS